MGAVLASAEWIFLSTHRTKFGVGAEFVGQHRCKSGSARSAHKVQIDFRLVSMTSYHNPINVLRRCRRRDNKGCCVYGASSAFKVFEHSTMFLLPESQVI